jgi:hypothetical protein
MKGSQFRLLADADSLGGKCHFKNKQWKPRNKHDSKHCNLVYSFTKGLVCQQASEMTKAPHLVSKLASKALSE